MDPQTQTRAVRRRMVQIGFLVVLQWAALFLSVGRWDWPEGWWYIGLYIAFLGVNSLLLLPHHKDLVAERSQINKNTKPWDRVIALGATIPGLILLIVAGLDARFGWSIGLSIPWKIAGFLLIALGDTAFAWSMVYNAYFAVTVRIQEERGHQVATGGPYRIVRHPAYLGMLFNTAGMLLLFSNVWAIIPAAVMVFFLILRTALEDKTLQAELPGYLEFTRQTRYRLIPGIW